MNQRGLIRCRQAEAPSANTWLQRRRSCRLAANRARGSTALWIFILSPPTPERPPAEGRPSRSVPFAVGRLDPPMPAGGTAFRSISHLEGPMDRSSGSQARDLNPPPAPAATTTVRLRAPRRVCGSRRCRGDRLASITNRIRLGRCRGHRGPDPSEPGSPIPGREPETAEVQQAIGRRAARRDRRPEDGDGGCRSNRNVRLALIALLDRQDGGGGRGVAPVGVEQRLRRGTGRRTSMSSAANDRLGGPDVGAADEDGRPGRSLASAGEEEAVDEVADLPRAGRSAVPEQVVDPRVDRDHGVERRSAAGRCRAGGGSRASEASSAIGTPSSGGEGVLDGVLLA